jgi:cytoskeletal protein CcmA (bactofilin family)
VRCPFCGHLFEVSRKALILRCPRCTSPLRLEDITVSGNIRGERSTSGFIRITGASIMAGSVVCGRFTNAGRFDGRALVHGPIELDGASLTTGEIRGQSLRVFLGATLRAKALIAPNVHRDRAGYK